MKRHSNAIAIQGGACNPLAITHSLLDAIRECGHIGTQQICQDPAVRLIAHQLAFILNTHRLDVDGTDYNNAIAACKAGVQS